MTETEWHDSIDLLIDSPEVDDPIGEGDLIEIEYQNMRGNITTRRGRVAEINDGWDQHIVLDRPGADAHPWKVGSSISVEYDHERDGRQRKHLGRVERVRRVPDG